jgi:hypothetical protein
VRVPADRLPDDQRECEQILQEYISDRVPDATREDDMWAVRLLPPPRADYYIDPQLRVGLTWWSQFAGPVPIRSIPYAVQRRSGVQVSLSDAWTIASWSRVLATHEDQNAPVVVLHADDHQDLMSPRLVLRNGTLVDLITGRPVHISQPPTVDAAVRSGAIGMGSFIVPVLASGRTLHIRHLRNPAGRPQIPGQYQLLLTHNPDTLLAPGEPRPGTEITGPDTPLPGKQVPAGSYALTETLGGWLDDLPDDTLLFLHVDCDYFSNRYDGDSDWRSHTMIHDPPDGLVRRSVEEFCDALRPLAGRLDNATIALSPGFFPAEYWQRTVESLLLAITVRRRPPATKVFGPINVRLVAGPGSDGRGSGLNGRFWHIYDGDRRAGSVWINQAEDSQLGTHASLTIELNKANRGKGIGRRAYRMAAEASGHDEVWLHMRRSNTASRKAAEHAGFTEINVPGASQLAMRWQRSDR